MLYVILNEWLYPFIVRIINIHGSGVLVALFGCCKACATWNAATSAQVLCTPFNHAPVDSVTSFKLKATWEYRLWLIFTVIQKSSAGTKPVCSILFSLFHAHNTFCLFCCCVSFILLGIFAVGLDKICIYIIAPMFNCVTSFSVSDNTDTLATALNML